MPRSSKSIEIESALVVAKESGVWVGVTVHEYGISCWGAENAFELGRGGGGSGTILGVY